MGIQGLMKLLSEECPDAIKEYDMENMTGRKVAVDASMAIYQFLIAVRQGGSGSGYQAAVLTNEAGEVTSHIQGMFNRTIKLLSCGIKPCYVFDGKPPNMKGGELAKRMAKRAKAEADLAAAKESGDLDEMDKFSRRLVKVTKQHNEDCKTLLRLMGVPVVDAPCEAEAQCAELAKKGKVFAAATEDMDTLTFRTPKLVRKLTFSQAKDKQPIIEIDSENVLKGLGISYEQFVDLCILCGCDYCGSIKGIGPKTALKLIKQYHSIEGIISFLKKQKTKYSIPPDWFTQRIAKSELDKEEEKAEAAAAASAAGGGGGGEAEAEAKEGEKAAAGSDMNVDDQPSKAGGGKPASAGDAEDAVASIDAEDPDESHKMDDDDDDLDFEIGADDAGDVEIEPESIQTEDDENFYIIPPVYQQARRLFFTPDVQDGNEIELKWSPPQEVELRAFLVEKMGFSEERVNSGIKRLLDAQEKKSQKRLDSFFQPVASVHSSSSSSSSSANASSGAKRKIEDTKGKGKPAAPASNKFAKKR